MLNTDEPSFTREQYLECGWSGGLSESVHESYGGIMVSLLDAASEQEGLGKNQHGAMLKLLANAVSMTLNPSSINEPFQPSHHGAACLDDFSEKDCEFFSLILDDISNNKLKARLADLIWECKRKIEYVKIAIDLYISYEINEETWYSDIADHWERASRLCILIRNNTKLDNIKSTVLGAISIDYPNSFFMNLHLAELLDKLNIDKEMKLNIANVVYKKGMIFYSSNNFIVAREYFDFSSSKYEQCRNEPERLSCLLKRADCFIKEAENRLAGSSMIANSIYQDALQAYLKIPVKNRKSTGVDKIIQIIRTKIIETGKSSLDEMRVFKLPSIDISEIQNLAINYVSEKEDLRTALLFFSSLSSPSFEKIKSNSINTINNSLFGRFFSTSYFAGDGRTVSKTSSLGSLTKSIENNEEKKEENRLNAEMQKNFYFDVNIAVYGVIIPALKQILIEHRITRRYIEGMCHYSSLVPEGREKLVTSALLLGFEYDFSNAIHLICPQFEHLIRMQLKGAGVITTHITPDGIETENGLNSLIKLPEAVAIFGEDLIFEIKAIFTDELGANLRNQVAHGLLDDQTSHSISCVYAWWMMLRLIVKS